MKKLMIYSVCFCVFVGMGSAEAQDTARSFCVGQVVFRMLPVAGGTYTMGCTSEQQSCELDEFPVHQVRMLEQCRIRLSCIVPPLQRGFAGSQIRCRRHASCVMNNEDKVLWKKYWMFHK